MFSSSASSSARTPKRWGSEPERPVSPGYVMKSLVQTVCMRRAFSVWSTDRSSPIVDWLRALARKVASMSAQPVRVATAEGEVEDGHGRCGRALQEGAAGHCFSHTKNLLLPYSVPLAYHILEFCQPKSAKNPPARSICTGGRSPQQYFVPSGQ